VLVFFLFSKKAEEQRLLGQYQTADSGQAQAEPTAALPE